jgi:hypothetical protein
VKKFAIAAAAALAIAACYECKDPQCSNVPPVDPVPPDWYPPAGGNIVVETDGSDAAASSPCGRACDNLRRLGCPEGRGSDGGVSCYRICLKQASLERIPASCWAGASNVTTLRACGRIRCAP